MARGSFIKDVLNSQGRNLGRLVTSARTYGLSSIQGDLGESGKGILQPVLLDINDNSNQLSYNYFTNLLTYRVMNTRVKL